MNKVAWRAAPIQLAVSVAVALCSLPIIMASVSAGFIFSHLDMVRQLGFIKALSVLLDALCRGSPGPSTRLKR